MSTTFKRCKATYHGGPGVDLALPVVQGGEWGDDKEGAPVAVLLSEQLQHSNALCCLAQAHLPYTISVANHLKHGGAEKEGFWLSRADSGRLQGSELFSFSFCAYAPRYLQDGAAGEMRSLASGQAHYLSGKSWRMHPSCCMFNVAMNQDMSRHS